MPTLRWNAYTVERYGRQGWDTITSPKTRAAADKMAKKIEAVAGERARILERNARGIYHVVYETKKEDA